MQAQSQRCRSDASAAPALPLRCKRSSQPCRSERPLNPTDRGVCWRCPAAAARRPCHRWHLCLALRRRLPVGCHRPLW
eukprot:3347571-Prymnesium_polylepis.1